MLAAEGPRRAVRTLPAELRNAAALAPAVRDALTEIGLRIADVRLFVFSAGPGSFTGLRIGATMARMLHSVTQCEVVAVSTLEVMAMNALPRGGGPILSLLDARPGAVFAALFEASGGEELQSIIPAALHDEGPLFGQLRPQFVALGSGVARRRDRITESGGVILDEALWAPRVERVLELGLALRGRGIVCRPDEIRPIYLRPPECEEVYEARRAAARARRGAAP